MEQELDIRWLICNCYSSKGCSIVTFILPVVKLLLSVKITYVVLIARDGNFLAQLSLGDLTSM